MQELFLDANAHLPVNPKAMQAVVDFNRSMAGHGHAMSPSIPGRAAATAMEEARGKIAELLGCKSADQIIFASTCTQACEWAVKMFQAVCLANDFLPFKSPTEHPAISQAIDATMPVCLPISIDPNGVVDIQETFRNKSAMVCIHLQNEIGVIQPIEQLGCDYLLSDMSQSAGKLQINLSRMPVDIAVFGAHKFAGPSSLGIIYLKDTSQWKMFGTGSRYFTDRPGTPDVASIVGTAVALEESIRTIPERTQRMEEFRSVLEPGLKEMGFEIVAEKAYRCPNTTFVSMPYGEGFASMASLGEHGIYVGLGSACGSAYAGASPLMKKLGRTGGPHDYMRISQFGEYASKEAQLFLDMLRKCIQEGK
jgi:cysteine desulfurase